VLGGALESEGIMSEEFMADRETDPDEPGPIARDKKIGSERPTVLKGEEARSGETSGHLRRILGISFAMVTIAFGILLAYWMNHG
jgi:hypothetical protein